MRSPPIAGDPSGLSDAMWRGLLHLAGEKQPPKYRRRHPLSTVTARGLERRRLIEWEHTEQRTGWRLTDKGRFAIEWRYAQRERSQATDA
jgi:hypothetical protein